MAPERAVTPQDESRLSPKMSVPASPIAGTPIRDAQSPISMLLAVAQSQSRADDDLTNLNWLHERDILKGMNINPSPSNSTNTTPMKVSKHEVVIDHSTPTNCTDESLESSDSHGYSNTSNPTQITAPPRNKHPHNVPYDPTIHTANKPPYSFSCLIFMAIEDSVQKALPVKEIYAWILEHFPYFKNAPTGWKNSVRHNLSLNKCFQKVEKAANLGKGSLWTVDPQYKPNLIQALNRSPFHPISTMDSTYQVDKPAVNNKPSVYRLPNPELFPYLARKLASTEMNNHIFHNHGNYSSGARIKIEDSLDAVDAAAAMLSLKNSQPKNCDMKVDLMQVITNSPSQDHTYSAADSEESVVDDDRILKTHTCRKIEFEDDEDRRIKEGAETLLNLAGITLKKRHNSSSDTEENNKKMRPYLRYDINKNEPEEKVAHFRPRLLRSKKKSTNRNRAIDEWGNNRINIENNQNR
ncbi:forkhead box protein N3-like [Diorhabda carinulata]|uniref:forkhead box protein N3-like n=1 Tax=Diorhabda sublineata TaxID=1163346 RepID=UPI0024E0BD36|nr:forkhead box protein N3-like [Diorhabda sublineata]XP_057671626.1 forkhead box protein N3-like [Diorhabda carinulata]